MEDIGGLCAPDCEIYSGVAKIEVSEDLISLDADDERSPKI